MEDYLECRRKLLKRDQKMWKALKNLRWVLVFWFAGFLAFRFLYYPAQAVDAVALVCFGVLVLSWLNPTWRFIGNLAEWLFCGKLMETCRDKLLAVTADEWDALSDPVNYKYVFDKKFHPDLWDWKNRELTLTTSSSGLAVSEISGRQYMAETSAWYKPESWESGKRYGFDSSAVGEYDGIEIASTDGEWRAKANVLGVRHRLMHDGIDTGISVFNDLSAYKLTQLGDLYFKGLHINPLFISRSWYRWCDNGTISEMGGR